VIAQDAIAFASRHSERIAADAKMNERAAPFGVAEAERRSRYITLGIVNFRRSLRSSRWVYLRGKKG
jgi:hypothetical protein